MAVKQEKAIEKRIRLGETYGIAGFSRPFHFHFKFFSNRRLILWIIAFINIY